MRLTIDERMDRWLSEQADQCGIPDEDWQRFIDAMRGTTMAAVARLGFATDDIADDIAETAFGRFLLRITGYRNRVPRSQRGTFADPDRCPWPHRHHPGDTR